MKGWLIVLIILAVLFLIGQLRLGGRVRYDEDGFTLTGIAGPLRLALLPPKERPKKAKKKPPKPKKVKQKPEIAEAHPQKKGGNVGRLMSLLPTVAQAAGARRVGWQAMLGCGALPTMSAAFSTLMP